MKGVGCKQYYECVKSKEYPKLFEKSVKKCTGKTIFYPDSSKTGSCSISAICIDSICSGRDNGTKICDPNAHLFDPATVKNIIKCTGNPIAPILKNCSINPTISTFCAEECPE